MSNRICLLMIVRDEAQPLPGSSLTVIQRSMTSMANLIDSYLICDTGSKDDTVKQIEEFMAERGKPGRVLHKEWLSYGENKSWLLEQAHSGLANGAQYLIWLDADEVFLPRDAMKRHLDSGAAADEYPSVEHKERLLKFADERPNSGVFMFTTFYGSSIYKRWQMVRNNQLYRWEMPWQEYLVSTQPCDTSFYEEIVNYARKQGNSSRDSQREQRCIKMLEDWMERHGKQNEPRCLFYLGQGYGDIGNHDKAIEMYEKRLLVGGYEQEKYIALLRLGRIWKGRQQWDKAIECLGKAEAICPNRLEAYLEHLHCWSDRNKYDDSMRIIRQALQHGKLNESDLFVERDVYDWRFLVQASADAYYVGDYSLAYELGKRVLDEKKYPGSSENLVKTNMRFYEAKYAKPAVAVEKILAKPVRSDLIVIDDFLADPVAVRQFALSQEFPVKGNYPGGRTKSFACTEHKQALEKLVGRRIIYWPDGFNGAFQYAYDEKATGGRKSWIHRDSTDYSAIIYLTPNAPLESGTLFYRHKATGAELETPENKGQLDSDSNRHDAWEVSDRVGNKFNRLVIFNGRRSHMSGPYFGDSMENCRLFLLFFFDVEK